MAMHLAVSLAKRALQRFFEVRPRSVVNLTLGTLATVGVSLSFGLYLASSLLLASSNGSLPSENDALLRDGLGSRTTISFSVNHFAPFFVWAPLVSCRCEVQQTPRRARVAAWLLAVPMDALAYAGVLTALQQPAPTVSIVDLPPCAVVMAAAAASWASAAFV